MNSYKEIEEELKKTIPYSKELKFYQIGSSVILKSFDNNEIDIKIVINDFNILFYLIEILESLDYEYLYSYRIKEAWVFKSKKYLFNIFLTLHDSYFDNSSNKFIEYLLDNEDLRIEYSEIRKHKNTLEKTDFIEHVIYDILKFKKIEVIYPDYSNTLLNVVSSISSAFQFKHAYKENNQISNILSEKKYKHIIFMILDGMGSMIMDSNLSKDSILLENKISDIISIYPSTTAAATTAAISGLAPIESSWTGWENYIKEINRNVVLFTGENYFTGESTGINIKKNYLPYENFFVNFKCFTKIQMPSFVENGAVSFNQLLKNTLKVTKEKKESFQYVYWSEPDYIMHTTGTSSIEAKEVLNSMDIQLRKFYNKIEKDTCVIISADHGHVDVKWYPFWFNSEVSDMLEREPSNDSRCISFKVKKEFILIFKQVFDKYYHGLYEIYSKEEAIGKEFFGDLNLSKRNSRIDDFLADFVAIAISDVYIRYSKSSEEMLSHHAGITKNEMVVPLIVIRK